MPVRPALSVSAHPASRQFVRRLPPCRREWRQPSHRRAEKTPFVPQAFPPSERPDDTSRPWETQAAPPVGPGGFDGSPSFRSAAHFQRAGLPFPFVTLNHAWSANAAQAKGFSRAKPLSRRAWEAGSPKNRLKKQRKERVLPAAAQAACIHPALILPQTGTQPLPPSTKSADWPYPSPAFCEARPSARERSWYPRIAHSPIPA